MNAHRIINWLKWLRNCWSKNRSGELLYRSAVYSNVMPTLVLGPGSINQAHQPDEYLETRFIKPTRELIIQVIHHFCWH